MKIFGKSVRKKNWRVLKFLPIFAVLIFGLAFVSHMNFQASAKDVSSNFTVTEAHMYKNDAQTQELDSEHGINSGNSNNFSIRFKWKYESSDSISNGDTISFPLGLNNASKTTRSINVPNMAAQDILDANGNKIGTWKISNRTVTIIFSGASVGRTSLEGEFSTARNFYIGGVWKEDMVVPVTVGNMTLNLLVLGVPNVGMNGNAAIKYSSSKSNNYTQWTFYTPGITMNELYVGEGAVALSSNAKLSNLVIEDTLSERATSATISSINARTTVPNYWTSGAGGGSGFGTEISLLNLFTKKTQTQGQSYDEFKASLNELEYGIYTDESTGRMTVVINIGSQPSSITYADALRAANSRYSTMGDLYLANTPFATSDIGAEIDKLSGNDNVINGSIFFFAINITEYLPQASIQTPLTNTGIFSYDNANGEHKVEQRTASSAQVVGSSASIIKGEAKLYLRDASTKLPISGAKLKLQVKDGETWKDVANAEKTTGDDGSIQVLSLDGGATYRWVQTSYLDHYLNNSYKLYSDEAMNTVITEFVMPNDAGVTTYATNEKESFSVVYKAGDHGAFSDITFENQYYGTTTPQPTTEQIVAQNGWTFIGWSPSVSNTVTANATYTAQWQRQTKAESVSVIWNDSENVNNTRPESVRVQLLQNGANYGDVVTIAADDHWTKTWSGLPVYDDNGSVQYTYSIKNLDTIPGYTTTVGIASNGTFTITNDLQKVNLTVNHYLKGATTKVADTETFSLYYGSTYSTAAKSLTNYRYDSVSGTASGRITTETTVNYYYARKTGTLTIHHYVKGTTTKVADDEISTVNYGDSYTSSYKTNLTNYVYDSTSGTASDTFSGDTVVIYYYRLRKGTVITHYYIKDTTTPISADTEQTVEYTKMYTTSPLAEIPAAYANYELVSDKPANYTGTMASPSVEVTYFYQKKDPALSSTVSVSAPETVANKVAPVEYNISYTAEIADYIGNVKVKLVDKLPYPIDADASDLDGGDYDEDTMTITWTSISACNTYTNCNGVTVTHNITLVYVGAAARDLLVSTVEGSVKLDNKDNDTADSAETEVRTPSKIIFRYTDIDGNEVIEEYEEDGIVGDVSEHRPPEIPGYTLVADFDGDLTFEEDDKTVTYHYVKNPEPQAPKTGDNISVVVALGMLASLGAGTVFIRKRR